MFFRKSPLTPLPMPPWMKWGVLAFLVVVFAVLGLSPPSPNQGSLGLKPLQQNIDITPYKRILNRTKEPEIEELQKGEGPLALCGQRVRIQVKPHLENAGENPSEPETLEFRMGAGDGPLILERGLTGMRAGGIRRLSFSPPMKRATLMGGEAAEDAPLIAAVDIALESAEPDVKNIMENPEMLSLRLYDTWPGNGLALLCGEEITIHLTLWGADGARLWESREDGGPLTLRPGTGGLPAGLELGLVGMQPGGKRTLVLPPGWQKRFTDEQNSLVQNVKAFHKLGLPRAESIIADVEYVIQAVRNPHTPNP